MFILFFKSYFSDEPRLLKSPFSELFLSAVNVWLIRLNIGMDPRWRTSFVILFSMICLGLITFMVFKLGRMFFRKIKTSFANPAPA